MKWTEIEGWFDQTDYDAFRSLKIRPKTILEVGTYKGRSTHALAELFPKAEIHTCDPETKQSDVLNLPFGVYFNNVKGQDLEWEYPIDLLFIDSVHTYDDTKELFDKFVKFVRKGGYVFFHDYHFPHQEAEGVRRFINMELTGFTTYEGPYGGAIWRK